MSLMALALLSGVTTQAGAMSVEVSNLPGLFEATCLDGQAKLSKGEVTAISFDQLPPSLKGSLGRPASAKVWKLNTSGRAYLYVLDFAGGAGSSPKVCGLASDTMDLTSASNALEMRVAGGIEPNRARTMQWVNAKDGYVATATTAAQFNVLQISWLSEADRTAALVQADQVQH